MNWLKQLLGLNRYVFEKVEIKKEVIDDICDFAKENHPREFIMLLQGNIKNKIMTIDSLAFQQYYANEDFAMPMIRLPITMDIMGSVHSHPGFSNKPSNADLHFFGKNGMVHLIIKRPYGINDIAAYDKNGKQINFSMS
jgi:proteasome lid subunit RPN8/RPN11